MRMLLAMALASCSAAGAADRALLSDPAMSKTQIVFDYGGELWSVPRGGGEAHVLASGMDLLAEPMFSPDGSQIAFTGTFDKNTDVYVIPATGGQPREGLDGTFPVENHGVSPDVTVWEDPGLVRQGHDPQLERAVAIAMQQLDAHPLPQYQRPPWRNYHPKLPPLPQSPTSVVNE